MRLTEILGAGSVVALCAALLASAGGAQESDDANARLAALEAELATLESDLGLLEDTKAIKRLQRAYGYYVDKKLSREIGALFADDPDTTAELGGSGVYVGKARIAEFYDRIIGGEGLEPGELFNHMILQGVVHVARRRPDRQGPVARVDPDRATRRERRLGRRAVRERVRQGRRRLEVQQGALVSDVLGALLAGLAQGAAADGAAARRLSARPAADRRLPVLPGGLSAAVSLREPRVGTLRAWRLRSRRTADAVATRARRRARQQDPAARAAAARARARRRRRRAPRASTTSTTIQNLQGSYGYYTDKMLWDEVVDLFADDGTLEIGPSGVYVGKDSIRRYLLSLSDGKQGPLEGVLYDHFQLQPIVTVADDGLTANGRWRLFLMTGVSGSGSGGNWGEGVYENEYVKEDGVWKIRKLHWFANFVAPYEGGWLNADPKAVDDLRDGPRRDAGPPVERGVRARIPALSCRRSTTRTPSAARQEHANEHRALLHRSCCSRSALAGLRLGSRPPRSAGRDRRARERRRRRQARGAAA